MIFVQDKLYISQEKIVDETMLSTSTGNLSPGCFI